jgi:hypothetical protein
VQQNDPLGSLQAAIGRGQAILVVGQDHSPDLIDQVLRDSRELFGHTGSWRSLPELYQDLGKDESRRKAVASLFAKHQPSVALLELASMPWAAVVMSAVDPVIAQAFLSVGSGDVPSLVESERRPWTVYATTFCWSSVPS